MRAEVAPMVSLSTKTSPIQAAAGAAMAGREVRAAAAGPQVTAHRTLPPTHLGDMAELYLPRRACKESSWAEELVQVRPITATPPTKSTSVAEREEASLYQEPTCMRAPDRSLLTVATGRV